MLGHRTLRKEDPPLLTGEARFVDDLDVPGAAAHARRAQPGRARHDRRASTRRRAARCPASSPCSPAPTCVDELASAAALRVAGHRGHEATRSTGRSRATKSASWATASRSWSPRRARQAEDAAEAVVVDYEELPGRARPRGRARPTRALVHADLGTNTLVHVGARSRIPTRSTQRSRTRRTR